MACNAAAGLRCGSCPSSKACWNSGPAPEHLVGVPHREGGPLAGGSVESGLEREEDGDGGMVRMLL